MYENFTNFFLSQNLSKKSEKILKNSCYWNVFVVFLANQNTWYFRSYRGLKISKIKKPVIRFLHHHEKICNRCVFSIYITYDIEQTKRICAPTLKIEKTPILHVLEVLISRDPLQKNYNTSLCLKHCIQVTGSISYGSKITIIKFEH